MAVFANESMIVKKDGYTVLINILAPWTAAIILTTVTAAVLTSIGVDFTVGYVTQSNYNKINLRDYTYDFYVMVNYTKAFTTSRTDQYIEIYNALTGEELPRALMHEGKSGYRGGI